MAWGKMTHFRNRQSPEHRESARRLLENLDKKNRRKRLLGARLANLEKQKLAVRFTSSFGPDLDAIDAFKKGEDYQGYVGKGKNKRLKFEVKGNKLFLLGHNIATKTKDGIKVSNAGFDTGLTYSTLKELGINAKRTPGGKALLHNKEIDAESGEFIFVPNKEISAEPIRAKKTENTSRVPTRTVTEQSTFRQKVEERAMKEQGRGAGEIPLSETAIQPEDQRQINKITGVKSKIPKEKRGTAAHHIFPVERVPGLRNNPSHGIMLTRKEHAEIHKLNPNSGFRKFGKLKRQLLAARLRAFTNTSSFVGNMRYDQDEQSMTGILSGKHYKWCGVPEKTFDAFQGAGSAGAFFNRQIKGQFDCNKGGILSNVQSRISQMQKQAGINPLVRKKKKGKAIKKIAPKVAMERTAKHVSASELAAKFRRFISANPEALKANGTFDPIQGTILDAATPEGAIRLQNLFESHGGKIGLNSRTDTRKGIVTDMGIIESQLKEIEQAGGIPAIGVFNGSLEATNVLVDKTDDEIITDLGESQRSTAIIDPDTKLRIVDNERFKEN